MNDILEIGTVVYLKKGIKKVMIIGRMVGREIDNKRQFNDYVGVFYPEGLIRQEVLFFNNENIDKVLYHGYSDEDNEVLVERLKRFELESGIVKNEIKEI